MEPTDRDREMAREWCRKHIAGNRSGKYLALMPLIAQARAEGYERGRCESTVDAVIRELARSAAQNIVIDCKVHDVDPEKIAEAIRKMPPGRFISSDFPPKFMPMQPGDAMEALRADHSPAAYQADLRARIEAETQAGAFADKPAPVYDDELDGDREEMCDE